MHLSCIILSVYFIYSNSLIEEDVMYISPEATDYDQDGFFSNVIWKKSCITENTDILPPLQLKMVTSSLNDPKVKK